VFGDLFLSSCPGMGKDLLGDIQIIKDLNIKCLISLVEENELYHLGARDLFKELDKINIKWIHFEIINFDIPNLNQYDELNSYIKTISQSILNGENIYIHCMAGLGRTGMIAALILTKLGLSPQQSIKIVRDSRPGSIETEAQENFVCEFKLN
jgi:ADP-ribosyl-[dinitrogen reductase] hydrolase